jgi:hypothetical protein
MQFGWKFEFSPKAKFRWKKKLKKERRKHTVPKFAKKMPKKKNKNVDAGSPFILYYIILLYYIYTIYLLFKKIVGGGGGGSNFKAKYL